MAIQVRRGNESSFQPSKMVAGEPAVTLDSKKIYYAFAPSDVKEIATTDIVTDAVANAKTEIMTDIANETSFAENQRILAESERKANEIIRVQNESVRVSNEQRRLNDVYVATTNCNFATNDAIDVTEQIENETLIIWKNNVTSYSAIANTYPTPQNGWTTVASDTGIRWRYNGSSWVSIGVESTNQAGDLSQLKTQDKSSLVGAINDSVEYANDGNSDEVSGVHYIQSNLSVDGNTELVEVLGNTIVGDGVTLPTPETPQPLKSLGYKKNLFDNKQTPLELINNALLTILPNGIKVKNTVASSYSFVRYLITLKPNTNYYFKFDAKVVSGSLTVSIRKSDLATGLAEITNANGSVFTTDSTGIISVTFYCTLASSVLGEIDFTNIQLEEGSTATSYVPYGECDFTVISNGKNLFDNTQQAHSGVMTGYSTIITNGITVKNTTSNANSYVRYLVQLKPNTAYYLKFNATVKSGSFFAVVRKSDFITDLVFVSTTNGATFTTDLTGITTLCFYCTAEVATLGEVDYTNIQLEEGSVGTTYSPYNNGYFWYDNNDRNLFDIKRELFSNVYSTVSQLKNGIKVKGTISGSWLNVAYNYDLKPNTTYNIKFTPSVTNGEYRTSIRKAIDNVTIIETTLTSYSFTTDANGGTILSFYCTAGTSVIGEVDYTNIQLEEQKTSTLVSSYNPYYKTIPYTLRSLPNGVCDSIEVDESGKTILVKRVGEIILDGSINPSSIALHSVDTNYAYIYYNAYDTSIAMDYYANSDRLQIKLGTIYQNTVNPYECISIGGIESYKLRIFILKSRLASVTTNDWNTWLSQNPITINYELSSPSMIVVSEDLKLPSFDGQTNVSVISTVLPTSVKASFRSSVYSGLQNKIKYLEELIADLYSKLP